MLQLAASDHVCPVAQNQQRRTRCRDQVADPGLIYAVTDDEVGFAGPALSADLCGRATGSVRQVHVRQRAPRS